MIRRETMIALRARRQALQIARQVALPRMPRPEPPPAEVPPPDVHMPLPEERPVTPFFNDDTDVSWLVLLLGMLIGFVFLITCV